MNALIPTQAHSDQEVITLWLSLQRSPLTQASYARTIHNLQAHTDKPVPMLTVADLQDWQRSQTGADATIANRLAAIKSFFSLATKTGYLRFNPAQVLRLAPAKQTLSQRILSEEDVKTLLTHEAHPRNRALLSLLYISGMRVSEICALCWCDVTPTVTGAVLTIYGKGGKTRVVPIGTEVLNLLGERGADTAPVFVSRSLKGHLSRQQVHNIVKAAAKRVGLTQAVSAHWLRHAHASHALEHGASLPLVQQTLGHTNIATTGVYLHARPGQSSGNYLELPK